MREGLELISDSSRSCPPTPIEDVSEYLTLPRSADPLMSFALVDCPTWFQGLFYAHFQIPLLQRTHGTWSYHKQSWIDPLNGIKKADRVWILCVQYHLWNTWLNNHGNVNSYWEGCRILTVESSDASEAMEKLCHNNLVFYSKMKSWGGCAKSYGPLV